MRTKYKVKAKRGRGKKLSCNCSSSTTVVAANYCLHVDRYTKRCLSLWSASLLVAKFARSNYKKVYSEWSLVRAKVEFFCNSSQKCYQILAIC